MKRILSTFALAASAFVFTLASAAETAAAQGGFPSLTFIGSGCPKDSDAVKYRWEGATLVIDFAELAAVKGPGLSLIDSRKNCSLTMDLKVPKGLKYALVSYSIRGHEELSDGDASNISVNSFFQGDADQQRYAVDSEGPKSGNFVHRDVVSPAEVKWSPCNVQRAHTINTAVRVSGSDRQAQAVATIDQLRLRFRVGLCLPETAGSDDQVSIEPVD